MSYVIKWMTADKQAAEEDQNSSIGAYMKLPPVVTDYYVRFDGLNHNWCRSMKLAKEFETIEDAEEVLTVLDSQNYEGVLVIEQSVHRNIEELLLI